MKFAADALTGASVLGLGALALQRAALGSYLGSAGPTFTSLPGISILKPLCGADDGLEESLTEFAQLPYPRYELLLGVADESDAAFPIAQRVAALFPNVVQVVLQEGAPGLNPKVNQLITLQQGAQYDILLISDSNTRTAPGYLAEMAAMFEDPEVGCATNPVSGRGAASIGATLDNMHLAGIGASQVAGRSVGVTLVVGKSQAIRRSTLEQLGGFEAYRDVLAEDFVIGRDVQALGQKIAMGHLPIYNWAVERSVKSFWERYARWAIIQKTGASTPEYLAMGLLNPGPLAALAWLIDPSVKRAWFAAVVLAAKAFYDVNTAAALGVEPLGLEAALLSPVKDSLLFAAWLRGWFVDTIDWRGKQLRVTEGSKLLPVKDGPTALPQSGAQDFFFQGAEKRRLRLK